MSPGKTAEPLEKPFGRLTRASPNNCELDGVEIPTGKGQLRGLSALLKALGNFAAVYAKTAEPIEMSFGVQMQMQMHTVQRLHST